jgi:hypothetical protein
MNEGMGVPGGAVEQIFGSHLTSALLIHSRERCIAYRFPPVPTAETLRVSVARPTNSHAARGAAIASLFDRRSLTVSTCPPTPMEKFCHAARTHSLHPVATPRGKFDGRGDGGPWRGGRTDFWVPPDIGSAHPFFAWNGRDNSDTVFQIRDPGTACNAFVGLHSTTTESDPG